MIQSEGTRAGWSYAQEKERVVISHDLRDQECCMYTCLYCGRHFLQARAHFVRYIHVLFPCDHVPYTAGMCCKQYSSRIFLILHFWLMGSMQLALLFASRAPVGDTFWQYVREEWRSILESECYFHMKQKSKVFLPEMTSGRHLEWVCFLRLLLLHSLTVLRAQTTVARFVEK